MLPGVRRRERVPEFKEPHALRAGAHVSRQHVQQTIDKARPQCDVILAPTTPTAAFALGENSDDPLAMYLNDVFAVPASLAGLPAMSVPAGLNRQGLPLGLQIIGRHFDEETVFAVSGALEKAAGFSATPAIWAGAK